MAQGSATIFDISGLNNAFEAALKHAEQLDNRLESMVESSKKLESNMKGAFSGSLGNILDRVQDKMTKVFQTKLTPDVDTSKIDNITSKMDEVVEQMKVIASIAGNKGIELFDTENIYTSNLAVVELQKKYDSIIEKIEAKENELMSSNREAFLKTSAGKAAATKYKGGVNTKYFQDELEKFENKEGKRNELSILQEQKRKYEELLKVAKMTYDERLSYLQKILGKELSEEQKHINSIRTEYRQLSQEVIDITKQRANLEKQNKGNRLDDEILTLDIQLEERNKRRLELEEKYSDQLVDLIEKNQRKVIDLKSKNLKAEDSLEQQRIKEYRSTPQGAFEFASSAQTQAEMEQAMKYLDAARKNIDVTTKEGIDLNDTLIKKYGELKTAIEEFEGKTKDQNTLVATESAKYARLLKELNKYKKSLKELRESKSYERGDAEAKDAETALLAEIEVLEDRKKLYAKNKESIKQAAIQVAADTAREETEIIRKEEERRTEISRQEEAKRNEMAQKYAGMSPNEAERAVSESGIAAIEEESRAIKDLVEQKYNLSSADKDYVAKIDDLDNKISIHKGNLDKLNAAYKEQQDRKKKFAQTPEGAKQSAKEAQSIQQLITAYKNLDEAKKNVNVSTKQGEKEYNNLSNAMDEVREKLQKYGVQVGNVSEKHRQLFHTGEQLKRMLTGLFSVSAIRRYLSSIINVRGEFELQKRSLQALLGSKDDADKLWQQTIQLALKSPFQIKELVTYTKQLAAYRVETDKLLDSTKMLADISAGLGVDMQRLILAYGQVKAANYLRGTELRQFSEAGINVLQELSKYFTEIEGRAVSVGDVFERVSRRMVSFADVDEVLKRTTSEGGMFYNMQEIQAETVKGLVSNLRDSVDVMLNEIGESNEGVIKKSIKLVKELVDNWREIADVATPVIVALVLNMTIFNTKLLQAVSSMGGLGKSLKVVYASLNSTDGAAKRFAKTLGTSVWSSWLSVITMAIGAIVALYQYFTTASREAKRLRKALQDIYDADVANLDRQVETYEDLVEKLGEVTEGSYEHKEVISQLNSQYGEYLGFLVTEKTTYDDLANSIDRVVYSMTQKARANSYEKAFNKVHEKYLKDITEAQAEIYDALMNGDWISDTKWGWGSYLISERGKIIPTRQEISDIFALIEKKVKETGQTINPWESFASILSEYYNTPIIVNEPEIFRMSALGADKGFESVKKLSDAYASLNNEIKQLEDGLNAAYSAGAGTAEYRAAMDEYIEDIPRKQNELAKRYYGDGKTYKDLAEHQQERINKEIESYRLLIKYEYELMPDEKTGKVSHDAILAAAKKDMEVWDKHSEKIKKYNVEIIKELEKLGITEAGIINTVYEEQATAGQKSVSNLLEDRLSSLKTEEEYLKSLQNLKKEGALYDGETNDELNKDIETTRRRIEALRAAIILLGGEEMLPENSKDAENLKQRAQLLEKMRREYEKARMTRDANSAADLVLDSYKEAWKAVGGSEQDITAAMLADSQQLAKYIEDTLLPLVEKLPKKQQESARQVLTTVMGGFETHFADENVRKTVEAAKRELSASFDKYQLYIDLKGINMPKQFAEDVFGLETFDLGELRNAVEQWGAKYKGTELEKEYAGALARIAEMEDKERRKNIKTYLAYTRDAIGERAKIKLEELRKLQEIEDNFKDKEGKELEGKEKAKEGVRKESADALNKYEWEQFKSSEIFASIFNDLEQASATSIQYAIEQIETYKAEWADMPVTEAKEMIKRLNELKVALLSKGRPSDAIDILEKDLKDAMDVFELNVSGSDAYAKLREKLLDANKDKEILNQTREQEISKIEVMLQLFDEQKLATQNLTEEELKLLFAEDEMLQAAEVTRDTFVNAIKDRKDAITVTNDEIGANELLLVKLKALAEQYAAAEEMQQKWVKTVGEAYSAVKELIYAVMEISEANKVWWDLGDALVSSTSQAIQFYYQLKQLEVQATATGIQMNAALGPIGWIVIALQAIVSVIKSIVNFNQEKINEKIEDQYEAIEKLERKYQSLEKSISEVYDVQDLIRYNQELQNNIELQKQAAAAAKAAAESGKDNEENQQAAEEAQAKYDELLEESAEKAKELFSTMTNGVFDDTLSAAEGFVDAWLEAYKEVGDGMSGLTEHFEDEMMSIVKRQAALQIVGQYANMWKDMLETSAEGGLDRQEIEDYINKVKDDLPQLSEALEQFFKDFPLTSGNELSGIQKGIQGITADQADVLAAYWNSVRFYMASVDQKFDLPLSRINVFSDDYNINPILTELKSISTNTAAIRSALESVIANNGGYKAIRLK